MSTLLVEVGVEELPAHDVARASEAFGALLLAAVRDLELGGAAARVYATPRRLAVRVEEVLPVRARRVRSVRGPARERAYDADGRPTKALEGFLRSQGARLEDVRIVETEQGAYVMLDVPEGGESAPDLLGPAIERTLPQIPFARPMRWGEGSVRFGRPVVWLVALLDHAVVPCAFAGVQAGRESRGHRFLWPGPVALGHPDDYASRLRDAYVLADREERRKAVRTALEGVAAREGLWAEIPTHLLEEVTDLVEWPTAFVGHVDPRFLALPDAAFTTPMVHHQRQFPVRQGGPEGARAAAFLGVRNGGEHALDNVRRGNERVLAARLTDALFFFERDRSMPPEAHLSRLAGTELGAGLGTLLDRARRVEAIVAKLAPHLADRTEGAVAMRAAHLAFLDRGTLMIGEFPELTGEMAAVYASLAGEDADTVRAIREGHRPKDAEDALPEGDPGRLLSVAMRAEEVLGAFVAGRIPTGSEDPYGVRRAALGIVRVGLAHGIPGGLTALLEAARSSFADRFAPEDLREAYGRARDFLRDRVAARLEEEGYAPEVAQAVCAVDLDRLERVRARAEALAGALRGAMSDALITSYRRVQRILAQAEAEGYAPAVVEAERSDVQARVPDAERALAAAVADVEAEVGRDLAARDPAAYFAVLARLEAPLARFFTDVMVLDPDPIVRSRRLSLLARLERAASQGADLSRLGRQRTPVA